MVKNIEERAGKKPLFFLAGEPKFRDLIPFYGPVRIGISLFKNFREFNSLEKGEAMKDLMYLSILSVYSLASLSYLSDKLN